MYAWPCSVPGNSSDPQALANALGYLWACKSASYPLRNSCNDVWHHAPLNDFLCPKRCRDSASRFQTPRRPSHDLTAQLDSSEGRARYPVPIYTVCEYLLFADKHEVSESTFESTSASTTLAMAEIFTSTFRAPHPGKLAAETGTGKRRHFAHRLCCSAHVDGAFAVTTF